MAGEPETLSTQEPLAAHVERHHYDRLLMLSDGVFAIAITLLVLEIRPPEHWDGTLASLIAGTWRALFGFAFGFAVVGGFWTSHRGLFARIRRVDPIATVLSLLFLLFVSLVPAAASLVARFGPAKGMLPYLLLATAIGTVQLALWAYAALWAGLVDPAVSRRDRWTRTGALAIAPALLGLLLALRSLHMGDTLAYPILALIVAALVLRRRLRRTAF
jgi:uncharacterized membrane protein